MKKFKDFVKINEDAIRTFTPDKIYTPKMVKSTKYSWETMVKGSIYNEDDDLVEAEFVKFKDHDMEGKYTTGTLLISKILPEMFIAEESETFDKEKTYIKYKLTPEGYKYYKNNGLGEGTGYPHISFMSREELELEIGKQEKEIQSLTSNLETKKRLL